MLMSLKKPLHRNFSNNGGSNIQAKVPNPVADFALIHYINMKHEFLTWRLGTYSLIKLI